jgi:hypothetical protein
MFDAIEDIPTLDQRILDRAGQLIAEIHRRWPVEKQRYLVWNDRDPNDSFEVDAVSAEEACGAALDELGWCVSAEPYTRDED